MNCNFPWSRHHACMDGPITLILFLKMFFEVQGESHGEKNLKNCLENSEKHLKHLSLAAAALL